MNLHVLQVLLWKLMHQKNKCDQKKTLDHCQLCRTLKYFDHQMVTACNLLKKYCDILNLSQLSHCGKLYGQLGLPVSMMNADITNETSQGTLTKTNA